MLCDRLVALNLLNMFHRQIHQTCTLQIRARHEPGFKNLNYIGLK